ncbi:hypothetical protein GXP67_24720 [Rhodocytophaga rosea]|uniref:Uncharacterized protein n=1 Tax=Rhodocytophaga rosea TaxID=2704465 RepID=A0A6C0GPV9_9BACT|nr:hypothetical protein [Rhodocytophaga rosea]QHT69622.1 hypothetical protein GXP67_24720 [Rhodocytophaga rosea]
MKINRFIGYTTLFVLLTIITQVGGFILLLCIPFFRYVTRRISSKGMATLYKTGIFISGYTLISFTLIPVIAARTGRVPLPIGITKISSLQPLTLLTCVLNRHYIKTELKETLISVSKTLQEKYPGSITCYLDANFPFADGFPLVPHLSHNDGRKVDLAFFYQEPATGKKLQAVSPSFIGYGVSEPPQPGETNMPAVCMAKGYWQYGLLNKIIPEGNKKKMAFDAERTRMLITILVKHRSIGKLFIEPHLRQRLHLEKYQNIRFHGCQAVRHDDHIHVQL